LISVFPVVRATQLATKACHAILLRGGNGATPILREHYYYQ
jgi:hypothetical protein